MWILGDLERADWRESRLTCAADGCLHVESETPHSELYEPLISDVRERGASQQKFEAKCEKVMML